MKSCKFHIIIAVLMFLLLEPSAQASPSVSSKETIVVRAPKYPKSTEKFAIVYSKQQLGALGLRNLSEVLGMLAGTHSFSNSGLTSSTIVRGADPNFTNIVLDGVLLNDGTDSRGGSFDTAELLIDFIKEVKVVYGSSNSPGSDAGLAATVYVTSIFEANDAEELSLSSSFHNSWGSAGRIAKARKKQTFQAAISHLDTGDVFDGYSSEDTNVHLGYKSYSDDSTFKLISNSIFSRKSSFPDDSGGIELATIEEQESSDSYRTSLVALFDHFTQQSTSQISVGVLRSDTNSESPGVAPGVRDPFGLPASDLDTLLIRSFVRGNSELNLSDRIALNFHTDAYFEDAEEEGELLFGGQPLPTSYSDDRWYGNTSAGLTYDFDTPTKFTINGVMHWSDEGLEKFSPAVGLVHTFSSAGLSASLDYRENFKLPSFYALNNPIVGNNELNGEESKTLELSLRKGLTSNLDLTVSAFDTDYQDLIDFEAGPPPSLVNRSSVSSEGSDVILRYSHQRFFIEEKLSYVRVKVDSTGETIRQRPKWLNKLHYAYQLSDSFNIYGNTILVYHRQDSSIPTGQKDLGSYSVTDLGASYQLNDNLKISFQVFNLFDKNYHYTIGVPGKSLTPFISLSIS